MANRNCRTRGSLVIDDSLSALASRLLAAAENVDDVDATRRSPHTQKLLLVFLRYLTLRRRRLTIESVREIVDDPPVAIYADLLAVLSAIPRGGHAAALTSLRSKVRIVALANEMSAKAPRVDSQSRSHDANRPV